MTDISVIFASRGRPDSLLETTGSLIKTATSPEHLEIIVAVDPDDDGTLHLAQDGSLPGPVRFWVAPERYGYGGLHLYLNELAKIAKGEWLFWFNDDMRMITPGWDDAIRASRPAVIWPAANHVHHANIAPAWPRAWSDATGHASPSPVNHVDTYWQRIGETLDRHDRSPITIFHDRADVTGNHDDQTYAEGRKLLGSEGMAPDWDEGACQQQIAADASIIRALL